MDTLTSQKNKLAALVSIEPVIAGRRLRPFSAGTLQLCRQVELKLITGGAKDLPQSEAERELLAFYFIHAFPLNEVLEACSKLREVFFAGHVEPLAFEFPARDIPKLMAFLNQEMGEAEAANVEAVQKTGTGGETGVAPPNI